MIEDYCCWFPLWAWTALAGGVVLVLLVLRTKRVRHPPRGAASHIVVRVIDLRKSTDFYKAIGLSVVETTESVALLECPKCLGFQPYLLLEKNDDKSVKPAPADVAVAAGYGRMIFRVDNSKAIVEELNARHSIKPIADPVRDVVLVDDKPVSECTIACFQDPDGAIVELIEIHGTRNQSKIVPFAININATDCDKSITVYKALGLEMQLDMGKVENRFYPAIGVANPGVAGRVCLLNASNGFVVDLIEWENPKTMLRRKGQHHGIHRFALVVPNVEAVSLASGWKREGSVRSQVLPGPLGKATSVIVADPDGTSLELVSFHS
mmetsp:Transcript_11918/g.19751  ORF Transcript_11918/g.19751 Transcript_11918/m.19751 type:complete len:323 (-) Transcript_11918:66-1034(-)